MYREGVGYLLLWSLLPGNGYWRVQDVMVIDCRIGSYTRAIVDRFCDHTHADTRDFTLQRR